MSGGGEGRTPIITFDHVTKVYSLPAGDVVALNDVSMDVLPGEFIAVMGPSGSGKSTMLNLIGCLDVPTSGKVFIKGHDIRTMADTDLTRLRRDHIGFVFQQFNLLPLLNVVENVEFPLILKCGRKECGLKAYEVIRAVGLEEGLDTHTPSELSGGQQQRVAIARALVNDPDIIICDEPTGNLDSKSGATIMEVLASMNQRGKTIIVVTHDPKIAAFARRTLELLDGRIV
ncbi:MAG: ABC transporter ATP-binding protein [Methanomicrobiales archaeon]|nr:ABC transporter ATP-binding protein [Methanomicrobiales archaeon]